MQTDLFVKKSAKNRLYDWLRKRNHALSHHIIDWGRENYINHPLRRLRELKAEDKIERMPDKKRIFYYGNVREQAWQIKQWSPIYLGGHK